MQASRFGVLFDMDGLLVETESLWLVAERETMEWLGGEWTEADQKANLGGPLSAVVDYLDRAAGGGRDLEAIGEKLIGRMEQLLLTSEVHWRPGARELLLELHRRGVPRALVSASYRCLVDAVMVALQKDLAADGFDSAAEVFDTTVAGDDLERTKPFPDPYVEAARRLNLTPAQTIVLEDSMTGATAGQAAGSLVIVVPSLNEMTEDHGRLVRTSLTEITVDELGLLSARWAARQDIASTPEP